MNRHEADWQEYLAAGDNDERTEFACMVEKPGLYCAKTYDMICGHCRYFRSLDGLPMIRVDGVLQLAGRCLKREPEREAGAGTSVTLLTGEESFCPARCDEEPVFRASLQFIRTWHLRERLAGYRQYFRPALSRARQREARQAAANERRRQRRLELEAEDRRRVLQHQWTLWVEGIAVVRHWPVDYACALCNATKALPPRLHEPGGKRRLGNVGTGHNGRAG